MKDIRKEVKARRRNVKKKTTHIGELISRKLYGDQSILITNSVIASCHWLISPEMCARAHVFDIRKLELELFHDLGLCRLDSGKTHHAEHR